MWTIFGTAKRQGIDPRDFIFKALTAAQAGQPLPSLVNAKANVDQKYVDQAKEEKKDHLYKTQDENDLDKTNSNPKKPKSRQTKPANQGNKPQPIPTATGSQPVATATGSQPVPTTNGKEPKQPPDKGVSRPDETPIPIPIPPNLSEKPIHEWSVLSPDEESKFPISQKEISSQRELMGAIFAAVRSSDESKGRSKRGREAKDSETTSDTDHNACVKPPAIRVSMRRLMAPEPAIEDLEPARKGLTTNSL
jgi:hypothetical protein